MNTQHKQDIKSSLDRITTLLKMAEECQNHPSPHKLPFPNIIGRIEVHIDHITRVLNLPE